MKHYGVLHGDTKGYSNIVRKLLGQLKAQMDTTGQKFGSWQRKLADGTTIRAIIIKNGAVPIYKVVVVPAEVVDAAALPPLVYVVFFEVYVEGSASSGSAIGYLFAALFTLIDATVELLRVLVLGETTAGGGDIIPSEQQDFYFGFNFVIGSPPDNPITYGSLLTSGTSYDATNRFAIAEVAEFYQSGLLSFTHNGSCAGAIYCNDLTSGDELIVIFSPWTSDDDLVYYSVVRLDGTLLSAGELTIDLGVTRAAIASEGTFGELYSQDNALVFTKIGELSTNQFKATGVIEAYSDSLGRGVVATYTVEVNYLGGTTVSVVATDVDYTSTGMTDATSVPVNDIPWFVSYSGSGGTTDTYELECSGDCLDPDSKEPYSEFEVRLRVVLTLDGSTYYNEYNHTFGVSYITGKKYDYYAPIQTDTGNFGWDATLREYILGVLYEAEGEITDSQLTTGFVYGNSNTDCWADITVSSGTLAWNGDSDYNTAQTSGTLYTINIPNPGELIACIDQEAIDFGSPERVLYLGETTGNYTRYLRDRTSIYDSTVVGIQGNYVSDCFGARSVNQHHYTLQRASGSRNVAAHQERVSDDVYRVTYAADGNSNIAYTSSAHTDHLSYSSTDTYISIGTSEDWPTCYKIAQEVIDSSGNKTPVHPDFGVVGSAGFPPVDEEYGTTGGSWKSYIISTRDNTNPRLVDSDLSATFSDENWTSRVILDTDPDYSVAVSFVYAHIDTDGVIAHQGSVNYLNTSEETSLLIANGIDDISTQFTPNVVDEDKWIFGTTQLVSGSAGSVLGTLIPSDGSEKFFDMRLNTFPKSIIDCGVVSGGYWRRDGEYSYENRVFGGDDSESGLLLASAIETFLAEATTHQVVVDASGEGNTDVRVLGLSIFSQ